MKTLVLLTSLLSTMLSWIQRDEDVSSTSLLSTMLSWIQRDEDDSPTYFLIIDHAFMDSKG